MKITTNLTILGCSAALLVGAGSPAAAVASLPERVPTAVSGAGMIGAGSAPEALVPTRKVPQGTTFWYPGEASNFVPGMWAMKRKGNKFWFASNTEGIQCMAGTISGTRIKYRYYDQDFDFPARTGNGSGRMKMSGRNLMVQRSHMSWAPGYIKAIPGASANKSWVTAARGKKALADCAKAL